MKLKHILALCCWLALPLSSAELVKLRTEYTETPLGLDVETPRFSWQLHSTLQGHYQTAYQLQVTDEQGSVVWNSGKVKTDTSVNIEYAGRELQPSTRYSWQVVVWDNQRKKLQAESWFETGLLDAGPDLTAWDGAQWIGGTGEDLVLVSDYLPVFKLNITLQLDSLTASTRAGFIYGANDPRLMDKNKNIYQLENQQDSSYILVELNTSPLQANKKATIDLYRIGYAPEDQKNRPFRSFGIPDLLLNKLNQYQAHTIYVSSVLGVTRFYINGEKQSDYLGEVNLNPIGRGGDYIAFPMVAGIGLYVPARQSAVFSDFHVKNFRHPSNTLSSSLSVPQQLTGYQKDTMLVFNPSNNSMPMMRTTFTAASPVRKARLYVTARGIYDFYINGQRIGNEYFNPGSTQYTKTQLYQTFDVTGQILKGRNAMGAILGEGWWSGGSTYMGEYWNFFGDRQSLLAKLVITYTDGTSDVITTRPETWTYYNEGPLVYGSFFQGEVYDARKEQLIKNWSEAAYNDAAWKKCVEVPLQGTINAEAGWGNTPGVGDYSALHIKGQVGETVQQIKELRAVSVEEIRPGVYVYDMGQNMAGVPAIHLNEIAPGKKITLRFAEVKYPDLPAYQPHTGMIMLENIRAAMAQEIYIAKGGEEIISPRFTYHGYRYVEITGIDQALPLDAVKGLVVSSVHQLASRYETSNPQVNKLWENITWSTYSNFISIPTDCPQRNERLGWSGDISVFSRTATYLAPVPQFLRRHLMAMRDVQRADGRFPDVAPLGVGFGETLWGSAGITVPWESYLQYNDKALLAEHYPAMKKYIEYLLRDIHPETGIFKENERNVWGSLGDWLSLEDSKNEKVLFWEAYLIYDLDLMSKMAAILHLHDDAERYAQLSNERKEFFSKTYFDATTGKTAFRGKIIDTQTSYVLPLAFNILNGNLKHAALKNLIATLTRENITDEGVVCPPYSLMTGFIGTAWISKVLSDNGYSGHAYKLLQQTTYPSWIYPVEQGATTIWERLNSYTLTDGFGKNNSMNSFNHYAFGAVGAWMYNSSLGIDADENSPGFKHFFLRPEPDPTGSMTFARGHYDSMYGRIESSWEIHEGSLHVRFVVPANTTATAYLPVNNQQEIACNGKKPTAIKGVRLLGNENDKVRYRLSSGEYYFSTPYESKGSCKR
ncbi:MAG: alpha-L-rhamnosidase [Paludibacter sp. 47-17]|nr:MAG: alpha-L-rhamnosidase [Paludibacter sp. 47-17]